MIEPIEEATHPTGFLSAIPVWNLWKATKNLSLVARRSSSFTASGSRPRRLGPIQLVAVLGERALMAGALELPVGRIEIDEAAQMRARGVERDDVRLCRPHRCGSENHADALVGEPRPGVDDIGNHGKRPRHAVGRQRVKRADRHELRRRSHRRRRPHARRRRQRIEDHAQTGRERKQRHDAATRQPRRTERGTSAVRSFTLAVVVGDLRSCHHGKKSRVESRESRAEEECSALDSRL